MLRDRENKELVISDLQGLNVERGVLVRPASSFTRLDNWELVKPGTIRKCKGSVRLTLDPADAAVVAFRDFQSVPTGPELLIIIDAEGGLYTSGIVNDPIALNKIGNLYAPVTELDEAPFVVCLPFKQGNGFLQYAVITVGTKGFPQKFDGTSITRLGIENPTDSWTEAYQHSILIPMDLYTHPTTLETLFQYTSPNKVQGVPIVVGRRYRWSWYNPTTKHDSSLAALHQAPYPVNTQLGPGATSIPITAKEAGTVITTSGAPYVMAVPMFLDNRPTSFAPAAITPPSPDYTRIRIWATRDGQSEFYLVPRIYSHTGILLTDEDGSIDIDDMRYGVDNYQTPFTTDFYKPIFDGFIPRYGDPIGAPLNYDDVIDFKVRGAGQTGTTLDVTLASPNNITRGQFTLPGDPTVYVIISSAADPVNPDYTWTISPAITVAPADMAEINFLLTLPIADNELITPFADTPGLNSDRENDPPPEASWGVVYNNRLFLLDANDKTRLVYSRIGLYESFPPDNVFRFIQADYDPITALLAGRQVGLVSEGADQRLVIGKARSTAAITGTDISDFTLGHLFPETGIVHKRAAIIISGSLLALSRRGLELLEEQRPVFIGSYIKDLIDQVNWTNDTFGPCFATDRMENVILFGANTDQVTTGIDTIFLIREPRFGMEGALLSPFSKYASLPAFLNVIQESGFGNSIRILAGGDDGHIYQLFRGGVVGGDPLVPLISIAETQPLPQDDRLQTKVFHSIRFDGNNVPISNVDNFWSIQFSTDFGVTWSVSRTMFSEVLIGLVGKQLMARITHNGVIVDEDDLPQISNFTINYTNIGESR